MSALPEWWTRLGPTATSLVLLVLAGALGFALHGALVAALRRVQTYRDLDDTLLRSTRRPGRLLAVVVAIYWAATLVPLPPAVAGPLRHGLLVGAIVAGAWLIVGSTQVVQVFLESRFRADVPDNLQARRVQTKVRLFRRLVAAIVTFLAFGLILITFEPVRRIGISLFASAGVAGLVIGIAAQPTLSNLVAGLQLALTEPIRLDDVVIVQGEWGWIEEIGMTYVVVRIWDQRRLVVPLRWFIENPFENWTRQTADIMGTVFLHLDYRAPVEALREELRRLVEEEAGELWDGRVCNLQVVDTSESTIKVRALVSAATSPRAWDLRCLVRERLVGWLQAQHPEALPRVRATVAAGDPEAAPPDPAGPAGPAGSTAPTGSTDRTDPTGRTDQGDPLDPADPSASEGSPDPSGPGR